MPEEKRLKRNEYMREYNRKYREKYPERTAASRKKWADANRDKYNASMRERYQRNIEAEHKRNKAYKDRTKEEYKKYRRDRYRNNPEQRFVECIRTRLNQVLRKSGGSGKTEELLGCSTGELKTYLESKFQEGMNWENHGRYGWHIDHIIPISSFDLTIEKERKKACHFSNLQPLWAKENWKKNRFIKLTK